MTSEAFGDRSIQVTFETSAACLAEADQVAVELRVGIDVLARTAFETYLDRVREMRLFDLDELGG